jgi:hypothetical protein
MVREWLPGPQAIILSARTGEGVAPWLERVLSGGASGQRIAEVDYDTYARGEALLGWLNASVALHAGDPIDWGQISREILGVLAVEFAERRAEVGHVKLAIKHEGGNLEAHLIRTGGAIEAAATGEVCSMSAELTVNARVQMPPSDLRTVVMHCMESLAARGIQFEVRSLHCLQPGRPQPTFRYSEVVAQA